MGTEALSAGVNQPKHEANHSSPSNAAVKDEWRYTSTPLYFSMTMYKDNLLTYNNKILHTYSKIT